MDVPKNLAFAKTVVWLIAEATADYLPGQLECEPVVRIVSSRYAIGYDAGELHMELQGWGRRGRLHLRCHFTVDGVRVGKAWGHSLQSTLSFTSAKRCAAHFVRRMKEIEPSVSLDIDRDISNARERKKADEYKRKCEKVGRWTAHVNGIRKSASIERFFAKQDKAYTTLDLELSPDETIDLLTYIRERYGPKP